MLTDLLDFIGADVTPIDDLYRSIPRGRLYVLLRLDSALSDASATFDYPELSIEHVLRQTPPAASE